MKMQRYPKYTSTTSFGLLVKYEIGDQRRFTDVEKTLLHE